MPMIPQYARQIDTPLTLGAPKQSINAPIEAFGGATAKDVGAMGDTAGKLGNAMAQIAVQQKEKEDSASLNVVTKKYLDWDRDYQEGVYAVRGADANLDLVTKSKDDRNAKIEELAGELRSPALGEALREKLLHTYNSGQTLTARHIRSQMEDWGKKSQAEVAQGHLDSLTDSAASLAPEEVEAGYATRVLPELAALAKLTGTPVEELVRKTKDDLFANTVKQAIATGDHPRANALLERWKDDIDAGTRASLTDSLRKKTIDDTAYSLAKGAVGMDGKTLNKYLDSLDSETRDAVRHEVNILEANKHRQESELAGSVIDKWDTQIHNQKNPMPSRGSFVEQVYGALPGKEFVTARHAAISMFDAEVSRRSGGTPGEKEYHKALATAQAESYVLKNGITDPNQAFSMVKNGMFPAEITVELRNIIAKNAEDPSVGKFVTDFSNERESLLTDKDARQKFENKYAADIRQAQADKGSKLNDAEKRGIGERLLKSHTDHYIARAFGRQDDYTETYEKQPEIGTQAFKRAAPPAPLSSLLQDIQDPEGRFVKKFGKDAVSKAYVDQRMGMVRIISGKKKYIVGFDGQILEDLN